MSKYIGRLVKVGVAKEASRGVGAAPTYMMPLTSLGFDDKVTKVRSSGGLGKISDSEEAFVTTQYSEGDLEGEVRSSSFGLILYSMLGAVSSAGDADGYTHTFTVDHSNQHQSLALTVEDSNTAEMYKLVMLESLELTAELDAVLMMSGAFMSKKAVGTTQTVPAATDEFKFTKKHLSVKVAADTGSLAAASAISVKNLTLTFEKNTALDDVLGTAEPEDILNHQLAVEGEITLNYEDETWKDYMRNNSSKAMEIKFTNTDETIGSGSTNPSLTVTLPKVDFFDWEPDYSLDEIVTQTFSFKASRDVANATDIISSIALVNDIESY